MRQTVPLIFVILAAMAAPAFAVYQGESNPIGHWGQGFVRYEALDPTALTDYTLGSFPVFDAPDFGGAKDGKQIGNYMMWGPRYPKPAEGNAPLFPEPNGELALNDGRTMPAFLHTGTIGYDEPVIIVYDGHDGWARTSIGWIHVKKEAIISWQSFFAAPATKNLESARGVVTLQPAMLRKSPGDVRSKVADGWSWGPDGPYDLYVLESANGWAKVLVDHTDAFGAFCRDGKKTTPKGPTGWIEIVRDHEFWPGFHDTLRVAEAWPKGC